MPHQLALKQVIVVLIPPEYADALRFQTAAVVPFLINFEVASHAVTQIELVGLLVLLLAAFPQHQAALQMKGCSMLAA
jgi:hypothetical protein